MLTGNEALAVTLSKQFAGMKKCDQMGLLKDIYFDQYFQKINADAVPYIAERKLYPCELNEIATYCINDHFYGLKVNKISIPHTMSIYAVYFTQSKNVVKHQLSRYMKITDYNISRKINRYPVLLTDKKTGNAILICDFSSEKD